MFRHWLRGYKLFADVPGYPDNREKAHANETAPVPGRLVGVRLGGGEALEVLTAAEGVTQSEVAERGRVLWPGSVELGVLNYGTGVQIESLRCNVTSVDYVHIHVMMRIEK